jgi:predicted nucleic acid-binding protein
VSPAGKIPELVLDSWPVMEWLKGRQPATHLFREMLEDSFAGKVTLSMNRMNYGEVIYSIQKDIPKYLVEQSLKAFSKIPIRFYSVDDLLVEEAAALKSVYSISYADAFAAAQSMRLDVPLVTGDKEFRNLAKTGLKLHWVGA